MRDRPGVVGLTIMAGPEPNDTRPDDYSEQDGDNGNAQHALAAKLEKHNKAASTRALTSAATYELAVAQGYATQCERRPGSSVAGASDSIDLVVLKS